MNPSPFPSSLPSSLVLSVRNNHVPPDSAPENIASLAPLTTRQSLMDALFETDSAIHQVDERLAQVYYRNATFSRESEGLRNLNSAVDWFNVVREQAAQTGQIAINERRSHVSVDEELDSLLSTRNMTTATLVLLNSLHTAFVLSSETEKNLVLGEVDVAYQNLTTLETAITDLREKNASLGILNTLGERVGVLRDVLSVETEKMWSRLVTFSEEGDIQLTIQKQSSSQGPTLSITAVAELLGTLNLLDSTMKSLASLLSRAFLDHLLENPVGWQFLYRKHDPSNPSITMTPTNFTLADLTPHAHRIFAYLGCITDFLACNLPPIALQVLIPLIIPAMTTDLTKNWLPKFIPRTMDTLQEYEKLIWEAQSFERTLQTMQWTQQNTFHEWCSKAGEHWGKQHKLDVLDRAREIVRGGVFPYSSTMASMGALEYEDVSRNGGLSDWTWDEDWGAQTTQLTTSRRKQKHSNPSGMPRNYECTAISAPLLTLLGALLQEYTHLPNVPIIQASQTIYPEIVRDVFSLFRASGILFGSMEVETSIRLINDCFYLAGEIGLMALGIGHLGYNEITATLNEVSQIMDLCGVTWREKYLENVRAGLIQRVRAAEGFIFPSNPERKERYTVIIAGVIQQIHSFSQLWMRLMSPDERCIALSPLLQTILSQVTEDFLLLPTLPQPDSSALSQIFSPLLSLEGLLPRNRILEFIPSWGRYRVIPQLLELDMFGILALWRNGRLRSVGWDATDTIEILERRFGRTADGVIREIRRQY